MTRTEVSRHSQRQWHWSQDSRLRDHILGLENVIYQFECLLFNTFAFVHLDKSCLFLVGCLCVQFTSCALHVAQHTASLFMLGCAVCSVSNSSLLMLFDHVILYIADARLAIHSEFLSCRSSQTLTVMTIVVMVGICGAV